MEGRTPIWRYTCSLVWIGVRGKEVIRRFLHFTIIFHEDIFEGDTSKIIIMPSLIFFVALIQFNSGASFLGAVHLK